MDREIQPLFDAIEEYGFSQNTMVVFTTDHGVYAPRGKGTLYDFGMANSLMMKIPAAPKPSLSYDGLIQNIDLLPTILDATGIDIPDDVDGRSFYPLLVGQEYRPHESIVAEWNFGGPYEDFYPIRAIRTERFHFIKHFSDTPRYHYLPTEIPVRDHYKDHSCTFGPMAWDENRAGPSVELFDIQQDPNEWENLAGVAEYSQIVENFEAKLSEWMAETHDTFLTEKRPVPTAEPGFGVKK